MADTPTPAQTTSDPGQPGGSLLDALDASQTHIGQPAGDASGITLGSGETIHMTDPAGASLGGGGDAVHFQASDQDCPPPPPAPPTEDDHGDSGFQVSSVPDDAIIVEEVIIIEPVAAHDSGGATQAGAGASDGSGAHAMIIETVMIVEPAGAHAASAASAEHGGEPADFDEPGDHGS